MRFKKYINEELLLVEGVYDPSIFKAIFLAGGPGSGKSYVASKTTSGMGLKLVNSDTLFEKLAKEANVDLGNMKFGGAEEKIRNKVRGKAKDLTSKQLDRYVNGRLGLVIDGTGRDYKKIERQVRRLQSLGYDTYMIFVNTTLDVALERNEKRERTVPEELVTKAWKAVQGNMGKFQGLFGKPNFKIVDNSVYTDDTKIFDLAWKDVMKFSKKEIQNPIAKEWINQALEAKRRK
jgi:cytidylate kinase